MASDCIEEKLKNRILIKMFQNYVRVVECKMVDDGEAIEYDPFKPEVRWSASVEWKGDNCLSIIVGDYFLTAKRENKEINVFKGTEDGPHGTSEVTVYLIAVKQTFQSIKVGSRLRLAKIGDAIDLIIDCDSQGNGKEYLPFDSDKKWEATLSWLNNDEISIRTGSYLLKAWRVCDGTGIDYFDGIETGPHGNSRFNVYFLSTNYQSLDNMFLTEWLLFGAGEIDVKNSDLVCENASNNPVTKRLGVARLKFPKSINSEQINVGKFRGYGILGGNDVDLKVSILPIKMDSNAQLIIEFDTVERFSEFKWDSCKFERDDELCAYKMHSKIIYPIINDGFTQNTDVLNNSYDNIQKTAIKNETKLIHKKRKLM